MASTHTVLTASVLPCQFGLRSAAVLPAEVLCQLAVQHAVHQVATARAAAVGPASQYQPQVLCIVPADMDTACAVNKCSVQGEHGELHRVPSIIQRSVHFKAVHSVHDLRLCLCMLHRLVWEPGQFLAGVVVVCPPFQGRTQADARAALVQCAGLTCSASFIPAKHPAQPAQLQEPQPSAPGGGPDTASRRAWKRALMSGTAPGTALGTAGTAATMPQPGSTTSMHHLGGLQTAFFIDSGATWQPGMLTTLREMFDVVLLPEPAPSPEQADQYAPHSAALSRVLQRYHVPLSHQGVARLTVGLRAGSTLAAMQAAHLSSSSAGEPDFVVPPPMPSQHSGASVFAAPTIGGASGRDGESTGTRGWRSTSAALHPSATQFSSCGMPDLSASTALWPSPFSVPSAALATLQVALGDSCVAYSVGLPSRQASRYATVSARFSVPR